ncbi:conserved hypothetical protein [Rhodopseudomonas palustris BisB5]|uniref:SnoaL-like domain-containing protein n=1 Tax=Rhodopseudomonas palustris (strain BisB5) TaxID=316057 RepID=Q130I7_RHOPS|nr:conserved hypothetical protein [Rhodopseudomonas palustris BisB5]
MSNDTYALAATAQQTFAAWRRALPSGDVTLLRPLLAENVTFYSPVIQSPIQGREAALLVLTAVAAVLENLRYRRTFVGGPQDAALEFSAQNGRVQLTGIDLIRFDAEGQVVEFEVMMRPLMALSAIAELVGSRVGLQLLEMKLKSDPG